MRPVVIPDRHTQLMREKAQCSDDKLLPTDLSHRPSVHKRPIKFPVQGMR